MGVTTTELANFRGDDQPALVVASLACRMCLSGNIEWSLDGDEWLPEAQCECLDCGYVRAVSLTGDQALRLSIQHV